MRFRDAIADSGFTKKAYPVAEPQAKHDSQRIYLV